MIPKGEQKSCYYCMNHENDEHVEPMRISMKIENFIVTTSSGRFIESLDFLDYNQERELDQIGYSGEDYSGAKTDRETFLNSLGLGDFKVDQIAFIYIVNFYYDSFCPVIQGLCNCWHLSILFGILILF